MKNPLLPDPVTHPRLYAREYLRHRRFRDFLCFIFGMLLVPVVGWFLLWAARFVFAL